ncbi:MAG: hydroxylamine reductase, partial [Chitinispirillaceae bacterium]|nr:hydroxylamine reductase [Chitinispirillaceae bacterium]
LQYQLNGIGVLGYKLRNHGIKDEKTDFFVLEGLFTLVTNVNFDDNRIKELIRKASTIRDSLIEKLKNSGLYLDPSTFSDSVRFTQDISLDITDELISKVSLNNEKDENIRSLKQLLLYGIRGMAAYAYHAWVLGEKDESVISFFYEALSAITESKISLEKLLNLCIKCGSTNIRCMELLNIGHTKRFGVPEPTEVSTGTKNGPAIIVSGHDLFDLEILLKQTEGTGVNIYTHGEMLPAHGYPKLKKYKHLVGHFGTAWQNQQKEFDGIPAAILFTTNCIQKPKESYIDRVFTTGPVGWPNVTHIKDKDFSIVIKKAIELKGFTEKSGKKITTGFGHNAVLSVADKVIDGVKAGKIKHFFLIGGCDGAKPGRNYYTEIAQAVPQNCIILTLACGKFRFNDLDFGTIDGIPRLLDIGQCNDAYSAIKIASALAEAFNCSVNDLPLSLILSWYEQKAVVILLSLLSLGIKGIRIGPSLPAFLSQDILNYLVTNFNLKPIGKANEDLKEILAK